MGQYWLPVNLTKKEFIDPHKLGSGLKLWEQLGNYPGTGGALIVLCAAMPEMRGGGDLELNSTSQEVIGRWAGDKIAIIGDYAEDTDLPKGYHASTIYGECRAGNYKDVSELVAQVIEQELGGKYIGIGWRKFVYDDESSQKEE